MIFQKTISVDFDGCITSKDKSSIHDIPPPRKNVPQVMKRWIDEGYIVIVNTLRDSSMSSRVNPDWESAARGYLDYFNIPYTLYNENDPSRINYYGDVRKISADIYIDDRNLGGVPGDFEDIYNLVKTQIGGAYKLNENIPHLDEDCNPSKEAFHHSNDKYSVMSGFSGKFMGDVNKNPLARYIYSALMSGHSTPHQVIEAIYNQSVKQSKDILDLTMRTINPVKLPG